MSKNLLVTCPGPYTVDFSQLIWEVVVVDDASPDGTQEVAKQLAMVYGEDKIVSLMATAVFFCLTHIRF
jgi:hypothetical protein